MKRIIITLLSVLLLTTGVEVFAGEQDAVLLSAVSQSVPEERLLPRLVDEADVLSDSEEAEVLEALDEVSERQQFDVVIAFVNDFEQVDVENAAYDYYDYNGFGYGDEKDGVYLYVSMAERDLNIGGTGYGITAFTDYGREMLLDRILPELGADDYYAASMEFVSICDDYITQAKTGDPYDVHNLTEEETLFDKLVWAAVVFLFFVAAGAIIAKIITMVEKGKIRNISYATHANEYLKEDSLNLSVEKDSFLFSKVESRYNPKETNSGSSGGSTISRGSSGVKHSSTSSKF